MSMLSKLIQCLPVDVRSLNSWWSKANLGPVSVLGGQIEQCSSFRHFPVLALILGEIWYWVWFFFIFPLSLTLLFLHHSNFMFMCVLTMDFLASLGDICVFGGLLSSIVIYFLKVKRTDVVGPFSMLILVTTLIAILQFLIKSLSVIMARACGVVSEIKPFSAISSPNQILNDYFSVISAFDLIFLSSVLAVIFLASQAILFGTKSSIRRIFWQNRAIDQIVLATMAIIFATILLIANNFLFLFLAWVGLNLSLYGLLAQFSFSLKAQEAAIKYFILGLISAGFFLFGIWLLYVAYGSIDFSVLAALVVPTTSGNYSILGLWGAILILFVLFFKLSAFPFQAWALDVYEGSSWFALSVLVLLVKPVFIILLIKTLLCFSGFKVILGPLVFFSGILSLIVGTIGAAFQQKIKRFLSMSSISHIGFMLVLLGLDFSNFTLTLNYLGAYLVSNFIVLAIVANARISGPLYPVSRSVVYWSELAFLNGNAIFRSPRTLAFSIALLSLAGLPPFLGFFTKLGFFSACISKVTVSSICACLVGLASMPIGVYNYLRIIRILWIGDCSSYKNIFFVNIVSTYTFNLVIAASMCILLFGGVFII